jgi:hypothetical protein
MSAGLKLKVNRANQAKLKVLATALDPQLLTIAAAPYLPCRVFRGKLSTGVGAHDGPASIDVMLYIQYSIGDVDGSLENWDSGVRRAHKREAEVEVEAEGGRECGI